jgi:aspartate kinase
MNIVVQKYGGSSVATPQKMRAVANRVLKTRESGVLPVVVVSAMGRTTDGLLALARELSPTPHRRELDMLISVGERVSMALLAMVLRDRGHAAVSFTGSQAGIITTTDHNRARIIEVRPDRVRRALEEGRIVIVGGFAGVSINKEVTTLGRGGSDTTAIALAAALNADSCEILSDVDGVYTADPRVVPEAHKLDQLDHGEILEMGLRGAKVLAPAAIDYARRHGITLRAAATSGEGTGTVITRRPHPGTGRAVAVTADTHALPCRFRGSEEAAAALLEGLDAAGVPWKDCRRTREADWIQLDLVLDTLDAPDAAERARAVLPSNAVLDVYDDLATATVVGEGIAERSEAWRIAGKALDELGLQPPMMWGSSYGLTALLPRDSLHDVVRRWHARFPGLEARPSEG